MMKTGIWSSKKNGKYKSFKIDEVFNILYDRVQSDSAFLVIGYPDSYNIDLSKIVGMVKNVERIDEDTLSFDYKILETPCGNIYKNMLEENVKTDIEVCAIGTINKINEDSGELEYNLDEFVCFSITSETFA